MLRAAPAHYSPALLIEQLGASLTSTTPSAEIAVVESIGLVRAINNFQVTVDQSLHARLTAELAGDAAWQLRIQLVGQRGKLSTFC